MSEESSTTTTYLITGSSSGLGLEFLKQLSARTSGTTNTHVVATCRKKTSSASGIDHISAVKAAEGNVITILEGIDVANDDCKEKIIEGLAQTDCKSIDVVIHNAGVMGAGKEEQSFENVTPEIMLSTVNLNGVGPLRVQQALHANGYMGASESSGGKVVVISTGLASIGDNGSGGYYAYRGSKALVNMVTKSMAADLKSKGISVMALAPGFVATEFGGYGPEALAKMGGIPPEKSVGQMVQAIDELNLETTGRFMTVDGKGDAPKEFGAGW